MNLLAQAAWVVAAILIVCALIGAFLFAGLVVQVLSGIDMTSVP